MVKKIGDGKWLIRVYLGRDADGKQKYHKETFYAPLKSMAQDREKQIKEKYRKIGRKGDIGTLGEWLDAWLERKKREIEPNTFREYGRIIEKLKPSVGELRLYDLTGPVLRSCAEKTLEGLSPKTVKNMLGVLKSAVRAGIEARVIASDALLGFGKLKVPRIDRPVLAREDLEALIKASEGYRYGLVIRLLCVTGARVGEILGLTWERVDLAREMITIDRTADLHARTVKNDTKTYNGRRTIKLDGETVGLLHEWKKKSKVVSLNGQGLVFSSPTGKPLHY